MDLYRGFVITFLGTLTSFLENYHNPWYLKQNYCPTKLSNFSVNKYFNRLIDQYKGLNLLTRFFGFNKFIALTSFTLRYWYANNTANFT